MIKIKKYTHCHYGGVWNFDEKNISILSEAVTQNVEKVKCFPDVL